MGNLTCPRLPCRPRGGQLPKTTWLQGEQRAGSHIHTGRAGPGLAEIPRAGPGRADSKFPRAGPGRAERRNARAGPGRATGRLVYKSNGINHHQAKSHCMDGILSYTSTWGHIGPGSWLKAHTHAGAAGLPASHPAGRGPGRAGHGPGRAGPSTNDHGPGRAGPRWNRTGRAGPGRCLQIHGPRPGPARCPPCKTPLP